MSGTEQAGDLTVAPILPSRDFAATRRFYEVLGFELGAEYETYLILCGEGIEIHFFAAPDFETTTSYAGCYIRTAAVDDWFATFSRAGLPQTGIPRLTPIADQPWGMREFALVDLDGSLLRIGTPLPAGK